MLILVPNSYIIQKFDANWQFKSKWRFLLWIHITFIMLFKIHRALVHNVIKTMALSFMDDMAKRNLKAYNNILNRSIRVAKKTYYTDELNKYKNDIRKTWDTLKNILNKAKIESDFPKFFFINGKKVTDMRLIASHFNSYFINVGSETFDPFETSNKLPFSSYLGPRCQSAFTLSYTNSEKTLKIIEKPKY